MASKKEVESPILIFATSLKLKMRLRWITLQQGATEINTILLSQYWKKRQFYIKKKSLFGGTNNIFADCTLFKIYFDLFCLEFFC